MLIKDKKDFLLGVSTAAAQIEGDDGTQGRGKSIWDTFCDEGKIYQNQNAYVSIDHYNRFREDVNLMGDLGVNAYRFSTSWSRLIPNGTGAINQKGVDFYNKLIDALLDKNIKPVLTLYHWDLPEELSKKGGFENPDFPKWFEDYSELIAKTYGDRVKFVSSFNEPINIIHSGYYAGNFAPGLKLSERRILDCMLNLHIAHGKFAEIFRSSVKDVTIGGFAMSTFEEYPLVVNANTIELTRRKFFEKELCSESVDVYLDPIYFGEYPTRIYEKYPDFYERVVKADLKKYVGNTDVMCYNNYSGMPIDQNGNEARNYLKVEYTDMGRVLDPNGMYWGIKFLIERYNLPIYVTENGLANNDWVFDDGKVHDLNRIEYIKRHLSILEKIVEENIDVCGYFVWSFLDNFEWLCGYSQRFGLVHVDFETLKRTPKDSFYWYKEYIAKNK